MSRKLVIVKAMEIDLSMEDSPSQDELDAIVYHKEVERMNAEFCEIDPANDVDDWPERDLSGEWGDE